MLRIPKTTMSLLHIRFQVDQMNPKLQHHHLDYHYYHYHHVKPTKGLLPPPPLPPSLLSLPPFSPLPPHPRTSAAFLIPFPLLHIIRLKSRPLFRSIFHFPYSMLPCSMLPCFLDSVFFAQTCTFLTSIQPCSLKLGLIQSSLD